MTGIAIVQRRFNAAILFAAMLLLTAGLVIGFALAQFISIGSLGGSTTVDGQGAVVTQAGRGVGQGLSPDDRQALRDSGQTISSNPGYGGLSPDARDELAP
ncbi:MAG TPA: hypothetical protein VEX41_06975 [Candidatus Eisenbacteria bacterium]|nr:hypothetical protein [Candidatus Eisenbacteria bacterium]